MKNFIQPGDTLSLAAPYDVLSGGGFLVGSIFAVASRTTLAGNPVEGDREGVFTLTKTSAQAWTVGQNIYWDDANKRCDSDGTVGILIGAAAAVAANPSAAGDVVLNGSVPSSSEGPQAAVADIALADAGDAATTQAMANACKAKINALLAELRLAGIILP